MSYIKKLTLAAALFLLVLNSCAPQKTYNLEEPPSRKLSVINIIDQNGLTETISTPDRIKLFECVNFLSAQPYKKVMRIYSRDLCGNTCAVITSYHPNGQPWQYLEIVNGRALGAYKEWFASGLIKIDANIIGGDPDLTEPAQKSWLFEGLCQVWNEQGAKEADLPYTKGFLEGLALYYHPCGNTWKKIPYCQNKKNGLQEIFLESGELLSETHFCFDAPDGPSRRWWCTNVVAAEEVFQSGRLFQGSYFDKEGRLITEIKNGNGKRTLFGKTTVSTIQEYKNGLQEGRVENYSSRGVMISSYFIKDDLKHGEEIIFYPNTLDPKLAINWYQGKIQGSCRSWYPNGQLENQREMSDNKKNGVLSAWYLDGNLMMIEEYDKDNLVRGEYFRRGEKLPVTEVNKGKGTATLFDTEGHFVKRIGYANGQPES